MNRKYRCLTSTTQAAGTIPDSSRPERMNDRMALLGFTPHPLFPQTRSVEAPLSPRKLKVGEAPPPPVSSRR